MIRFTSVCFQIYIYILTTLWFLNFSNFIYSIFNCWSITVTEVFISITNWWTSKLISECHLSNGFTVWLVVCEMSFFNCFCLVTHKYVSVVTVVLLFVFKNNYNSCTFWMTPWTASWVFLNNLSTSWVTTILNILSIIGIYFFCGCPNTLNV